jgi:transposase
MTIFVGIDWADAKHDICLLDAQGHILTEFIIPDTTAGYQQLQARLQPLSAVQILIERPEGRLVDFLLQRRWKIYFIPPSSSAALRPRRSKTDRADAYLLATALKNQHPDCRLIHRVSDLCEQLRQVVQIYDQLARELRRVAQQLRDRLKVYYPAVLTIFRKVQQPLTYAFLTAFPDPQVFQTLPLTDLQAFFKHHRYRYAERVAHHWETLRQEQPLAQPTQGYQLATTAALTLLQVLDQQLRQLTRQINQLLQQHPDAAWWRAFPGLGSLNAARLLSHLGDNRAAFPSVAALRTQAGTVPITRSSGKRRSVHFRRQCSRPLRKAFYDLAMNSKKKSAWARQYFDDQLARGHARPRANRALANRWVGIVWKLWQTGQPYAEHVHQANRQKNRAMALTA